MTFRAEVGTVDTKLNYEWTIDKGTITSGQGTSTIIVLTNRELAGESITATVKVYGLPTGCENTANELGSLQVFILIQSTSLVKFPETINGADLIYSSPNSKTILHMSGS